MAEKPRYRLTGQRGRFLSRPYPPDGWRPYSLWWVIDGVTYYYQSHWVIDGQPYVYPPGRFDNGQ